VYIGVLEACLGDVHQELHDMLDDPVFQQDNAKIHTGKNTMAWFEEHRVQVVTWPANAPNMNLIKYVVRSWRRGYIRGFQKFTRHPVVRSE